MRRSLRILRNALIGLTAILVLAAAFVAWLLQRPSGGAWLLANLPGVQVEAPEGSLLGDFRAKRLLLTWAGGEAELRGLRWSGLGASASQRVLRARELAVDEVIIRTQPSTSPTVEPPELTLPLGVHIARLAVGQLSWSATQPPLKNLVAEVNLPRSGTHHIKLVGARWQQLLLTGDAKVDTAAPLHTEAVLTVQQNEGTDLPWMAVAAARGPLAKLTAKAELEAAKQTLKLEGQVQPFAPWPVNALLLRADKFDLAALSALAPGLPRTALTGTAKLNAPALNAEATLQADLRNDAAGRWDQGALPVRQLAFSLAGRPDQLTSLSLTALDAQLSGGGRVQGKGQRSADGRWQLDARVQGLRPEALDARATPARLDGPLLLSGGKADQPLSARLDLRGTLQAKPLRLRAQVQGRLLEQGSRWQIEEAVLASGEAELKASGRVDIGTSLSASLSTQVRQFDPHLLWRGEPGSAWARLPGATRLNADAKLDLRGNNLETATGSVDATVQPSQFAGLPLDGQFKLTRPRAADAASFDAQARLGSNRAQASGNARPTAINAKLKLQAPKLAELNPLLALFDQGPVTGQADGDGEVQLLRVADNKPGKSTAWRAGGSGRLALDKASALGITLANARAQGSLPLPGADGDGPLALTLELGGVRHPQANVKLAKVELQGRRSAHEIKAQLAGHVPAPAGSGRQDINLGATLQANGRWDGEAWAGRIAKLDVAPLRPGAPATLAASNVALRVGPGLRVTTEPGRAEVGGAFVRWQALSWQGGEQADLRAELQLEDLAAAPLLARWQPDFGWSGDLRVTGHASLALVGEQLTADLLVERASGDLRVTDELGRRRLGLTDLRLALNVRDGVWQLAQGLAGKELGSLGGALTLRPTGLWPDAATPIGGVLQANVSDLATWGRWVPAGWRLGGRASATLQLGGTLGTPDVHGRAEGEGIALRHLLYGVDFNEGRFTLDLKGQHAELTQLEARGGDGWLRATGRAELGSTPTAHVELTADKLRVLSRVDRRIVASGEARLDLNEQGLQLGGKLRADEGLIDFTRGDAPALADDVTVVRSSRSIDAAAIAPAPRAPRNTQVDVSLDFGRDFKVRGRGLATTLRGQLQIAQKPEGPLRVTGKLAADGGQYAAYGQKLEIERGDISFTGSLDNPSLDLLAVRPNLDVRVGVYVGGTALAPRVNLYSVPDMSDTDKLSWLLLGREPDGLGRTDTALLQRAALALLSGEGEGMTGRALRNLGLDEISLSQSDGDTRATIVRLGKQISRRWYVGYERSLNATTGSWQLIYRIAQRFTLRAQSGDDTALDLIWQWKWD
ncbi:translocation/assembly module TamB domain-containing protein [Roseateles sp. LYH14W]|uniref:Translocation/assembly module TamB domain-containing protein n=1 Tax=Pelomonas parva TaxID=3299032 RepID=A0ABW7EYN0_9BURK